MKVVEWWQKREKEKKQKKLLTAAQKLEAKAQWNKQTKYERDRWAVSERMIVNIMERFMKLFWIGIWKNEQDVI